MTTKIESEPAESALAETAARPIEVGTAPFAPLQSRVVSPGGLEVAQLLDIPVTLTVELGRVRVPLERVTRFAPGVVVDLGRASTDPVDILVNGTAVARGEVVTVGNKLGIRITDLVSAEERLKRLAK